MKFSLLFVAAAVAAPLALGMHPVDPLPPSTTTTSIRRHPIDPLPPTTTVSSDDKCSQCLKRQAQGENIACGTVCADVNAPAATTKPLSVKTTAALAAGEGDICYRFCEGGEQSPIKVDCAEGLECTSPGGIGFDSCYTRAYTCQKAAAPTTVAATTASKSKFAGRGEGASDSARTGASRLSSAPAPLGSRASRPCLRTPFPSTPAEPVRPHASPSPARRAKDGRRAPASGSSARAWTSRTAEKNQPSRPENLIHEQGNNNELFCADWRGGLAIA